MLKIQSVLFIFLLLLTPACQAATPPPDLTVIEGGEFTLAQDQSATIAASGLTLKLIGVTGDERCPSQIECAASGPVSISLTVQMSAGEPTNINLQTFTDYQGRAPDMEFEGIQDRVEYEGYVIRVVGVLPYPATLADKIKDSDYRVTFIVNKA